MLIATLENTSTTETIGPGQDLTLPAPFAWLTLAPSAIEDVPITTEELTNRNERSGFTPSAELQQLVQEGKLLISFAVDVNPLTVGDASITQLVAIVGSGLPPFVPEQFAALIENPAGVAVFQRLTEDMILPGYAADLVVTTGTVFEIGTTVAPVSFTVSYTRPAEAATIDDGSGPVALISPFTAVTLPGPYTETAINATQSFTLLANETGGPTVSDIESLRWQPLVFFGEEVPPGGGGFTEAFIEGLAGSALDNNRQRTIAYTAAAAEKLYYAFPAVYGTPTFIDADTNFAAGFTLAAASVSVTNTLGVTNSYDVYESDQAGLGSVNIRVQ